MSGGSGFKFQTRQKAPGHHHAVKLQSAKTALHTSVRQHDSELGVLAHRIAACEGGVEDVCTKLAALKQEVARGTDEHRRAITDFTTHADGTQAKRKATVRNDDA